MGLRNKKFAIGLVSVGALLLAACGGSDGDSAGGTETIRIARNNWTASAIEVEIAVSYTHSTLPTHITGVFVRSGGL